MYFYLFRREKSIRSFLVVLPHITQRYLKFAFADRSGGNNSLTGFLARIAARSLLKSISLRNPLFFGGEEIDECGVCQVVCYEYVIFVIFDDH